MQKSHPSPSFFFVSLVFQGDVDENNVVKKPEGIVKKLKGLECYEGVKPMVDEGVKPIVDLVKKPKEIADFGLKHLEGVKPIVLHQGFVLFRFVSFRFVSFYYVMEEDAKTSPQPLFLFRQGDLDLDWVGWVSEKSVELSQDDGVAALLRDRLMRIKLGFDVSLDVAKKWNPYLPEDLLNNVWILRNDYNNLNEKCLALTDECNRLKELLQGGGGGGGGS